MLQNQYFVQPTGKSALHTQQATLSKRVIFLMFNDTEEFGAWIKTNFKEDSDALMVHLLEHALHEAKFLPQQPGSNFSPWSYAASHPLPLSHTISDHLYYSIQIKHKNVPK